MIHNLKSHFNQNDLGKEAIDEDGVCDDNLIHVLPGNYLARCILCGQISNTNPAWQCRKRMFTFIITEGPFTGVKLARYYNVPGDGRYNRHHAYFKDWYIANGSQLPSRGDRLSACVFKDKIFEVCVRDSKDNSNRLVYSVIGQINKLVRVLGTTDNSPCLLPIT